MDYKVFIGIDVSKNTIDAFIHARNLHHQFRNDREGFSALIHWIHKHSGFQFHTDVFVCFEHTGLYSLSLAAFLDEVKIPFAMISALQIKRSMGIVRGKTDKIDSRRIAEYLYLHRESISPTRLPSQAILQLQPLLTLRSRLSRERGGYQATQKEQLRFLADQQVPVLQEAYTEIIDAMTNQIMYIEKAIRKIIRTNDDLKQTFDLITGIKGVGFIVAAYLIVYTHNFTRFENWRKFACYAGIAPFENQSGTIRGKTKLSPLANKQIKTILHMGALRAAHTDKELSIYYQKRIDEGKSKLETLNIIRNKVISRVFAIAKRKTPYVDIARYAAA